MNSTRDLLHQILDPNLSPNERAQLRCQLAAQLEHAGNYEAAQDAMGELWQEGERPDLEALDQGTAANVLLRVGVLTGSIGSTKQIVGSQEQAKNLISESGKIFESLHDVKKVAEAQSELAVCYGREGQLDNARTVLSEALSRLDARDGDLNSRALLRSAIVEKLSYRLSDALNILTRAAPLFETSANHTLRGTFHYEFANVLRRVGEIENCADYIDRAVIEYTAASFHFEQAGLARYQACVENNLALVFLKTNNLAEAHEHLDRAQALFTRCHDSVHLAQVEDTRARVMLAEGAFAKAERIAKSAVRILETGGEQSILAEALTTHGIALAGLGDKEQARVVFERAISVAEQASDLEGAGIAALTLFEQLAQQLSDNEIYEVLERAHYLLKDSRSTTSRNRLIACLYRALSMLHTFRPDWDTFSLEQTLHRHEARYIQLALEDAGGVISRAARLLGLKYQKVQYMLKNPHKNLRPLLAPIAATPQQGARIDEESILNQAGATKQNIQPIRILHVADDSTVAGVVQEIAQQQGWNFERMESNAALQELAGNAEYDLLLVDHELSDLRGLDLIEQVRGLFHRRYMPIVMMSGKPDEAAAREAGADAFLRKPEGIGLLVITVTRLLEHRNPDA